MTRQFIKKLLVDRRGTSAIEMGLICALIVLAMLGALRGFASESTLTFNKVANETHDAIAASHGG